MGRTRRERLGELLGDPRRYERQIDRLHARHLHTSGLYEMAQDGVSLATLIRHRRRVARLLARAVRRGRYRSEPARLRTITVDGKERRVFSYRLTDVIVHGAVAELIEELSGPELSSRLYSYRRGLSWHAAVSDLAAYVREQRVRHADPRHRHLYVVRRDVDAYTDSIPVWLGAPVWRHLERLLPLGEDGIHPGHRALVESVVRPEVVRPDGSRQRLDRGVATGQPISCVLFNLCLSTLDTSLDRVPDGFYARYSDDVLFAHPNADRVRAASADIDRVLAAEGLQVKREKSRDLYLTAAARPSACWSEAQATSGIEFLGVRVDAAGIIGLSAGKVRRLLHEVSQRSRRTAALLADAPLDERGQAVCVAVNRMLDPDAAPYVQQSSAQLLRHVVTDRCQLAHLDHLVARVIIRAVTGRTNVRAFRSIPYRRLREEWGLVSLEHARNRAGRAPAR